MLFHYILVFLHYNRYIILHFDIPLQYNHLKILAPIEIQYKYILDNYLRHHRHHLHRHHRHQRLVLQEDLVDLVGWEDLVGQEVREEAGWEDLVD